MILASTNVPVLVSASTRRESRIVLVARDASFDAALTRVLEEDGFAVWSVPDAREALACVVDFPPEQVIVDLDSEGADGFGLLRGLTQAHAAVKVVVCTRAPSMEPLDAITRVHLGIDAIVQRPCLLDAIVKVVNQLNDADAAVVHLPLKGVVVGPGLAVASAAAGAPGRGSARTALLSSNTRAKE